MVDGSLPGTPASSTTKTGRHVIAAILLKVALKHKKIKSIKSNSFQFNKKYVWILNDIVFVSNT